MDMYFLKHKPDVTFFAQATNSKGDEILGSGGSLFIRLKTLAGAINRVKKAHWHKSTKTITIWDRFGHPRASVFIQKIFSTKLYFRNLKNEKENSIFCHLPMDSFDPIPGCCFVYCKNPQLDRQCASTTN